MIKWLEQTAALSIFNLRSIRGRAGSALAALLGVAGVVAVLVGVLSIGRGFTRAMTIAGSPDVAIVTRAGSDSEMSSILTQADVDVIAQAPGIARDESGAIVSPELFVVINLPKRSTGTDANVPLRGVGPDAFEVRDEIEIARGREPRWGTHEVVVGAGAAREFEGLELGEALEVGGTEWEVVGEFTADGGVAESEIWTGSAVLQDAYRRGTSYQSVFVELVSPASLQRFEDALTTDPRVNVQVERETDYYREQSMSVQILITTLGYLIAGLMGLAAVFGALNTMYTAVAARTREIATLRALGFSRSPVVVSTLVESTLLAAVGGLLGAFGAYVAFDGYRAATMNWQSFSQVAFAFEVDAVLLSQGILYALLIGLVGGLLPAIRAARLPVATALREL